MSPCLFPGKHAVLHLAAGPVPPLVVSAPRRPQRRGHLLPERWPVPRLLPPQEEITLRFLQLWVGAIRERHSGEELLQRGHWPK